MATRYPLVLNGSQIQELQDGDSLAGAAATSDTLLVSGVARTASIPAVPNTIPSRDGSADIFANVFRGVATSAQYADVAEKYEADTIYELLNSTLETVPVTVFDDRFDPALFIVNVVDDGTVLT